MPGSSGNCAVPEGRIARCSRTCLIGRSGGNRLPREEERQLQSAAQPDQRQNLQEELEDLQERQWLARHLPVVEKEIARLAEVERWKSLVQDLDSTAVTRKSTQITEQVVSKELTTAFANELERLRVHTPRVQVKRAPGRYGAPRYQIDLEEPAPRHAKAAEVLSEGEHRIVALAAFLAELTTSGDHSALIFDDPVSSLDHNWRSAVARRLVEEARHRQVVVFTHDLVFLLFLQEAAAEIDVGLKHWRLVRREPYSGVLIEEPPGRKVKERVADLNRRIQDAGALKRREGDAAYEPAAREIYRLLRVAWEGAVEEVLLCGVVTRFERAINTKQLRHVVDITKEDIRVVERNMTKCSGFAHDEAAAIQSPVPEPEEIKQDIADLKCWCATIRRRR